MDTTIIGLIATATPLLLFAALFLRKSRPVLLFFVALSAIALGYLYTTGAIDDVGAVLIDVFAHGTAASVVK